MPNYALAASVETKRIPWGAVPGNYQLTIINRDTGQPAREPLEYPNANVAIPDLAEGKYRLALVRLDANTRQPITEAVTNDFDVVAPVAEVPVSFAVVPT